jgi:hypothetical protein
MRLRNVMWHFSNYDRRVLQHFQCLVIWYTSCTLPLCFDKHSNMTEKIILKTFGFKFSHTLLNFQHKNEDELKRVMLSSKH